MEFAIHLCFNGNCQEAFIFYQKLFGGQLSTLTYGASPMANTVPPSWSDKIVHATLTVDGRNLAGADVDDSFQAPQGFFVLLNPATMTEAERIFAALAEGGSVRMPLEKTFWSPGFGVVVDRFGVPWELSVEAAA